MPIIDMVNDKLTVNKRPARWVQWTLAVADVDGSASGEGEGISLPGALGGLPGGSNVASEEELFTKFNSRVEGEADVVGPGGSKAKLKVDFRAKRANEFTGPGIRKREAKEGEANEIRAANQLANDLVESFSKDITSSVDDMQKKEQRTKLAAALRALADAM